MTSWPGVCCFYFKDMITALKAALSGSLESVILGLMKSTAQYDASVINGSIKVNAHSVLHRPLAVRAAFNILTVRDAIISAPAFLLGCSRISAEGNQKLQGKGLSLAYGFVGRYGINILKLLYP